MRVSRRGILIARRSRLARLHASETIASSVLINAANALCRKRFGLSPNFSIRGPPPRLPSHPWERSRFSSLSRYFYVLVYVSRSHSRGKNRFSHVRVCKRVAILSSRVSFVNEDNNFHSRENDPPMFRVTHALPAFALRAFVTSIENALCRFIVCDKLELVHRRRNSRIRCFVGNRFECSE